MCAFLNRSGRSVKSVHTFNWYKLVFIYTRISSLKVYFLLLIENIFRGKPYILFGSFVALIHCIRREKGKWFLCYVLSDEKQFSHRTASSIK